VADRSAVARSAQHRAQLSINQPAAVGITTRCVTSCVTGRRPLLTRAWLRGTCQTSQVLRISALSHQADLISGGSDLIELDCQRRMAVRKQAAGRGERPQ